MNIFRTHKMCAVTLYVRVADSVTLYARVADSVTLYVRVADSVTLYVREADSDFVQLISASDVIFPHIGRDSVRAHRA